LGFLFYAKKFVEPHGKPFIHAFRDAAFWYAGKRLAFFQYYCILTLIIISDFYYMIKIKVRESRGISIIDIEGRIDINASGVIETIGSLIRNNKLRILCNFDNVELVDYSGLSILAIAFKNVSNHKGSMKFCNVQLHVKELFKVVQMDKVFHCYENEELALRNFDEKMVQIEKLVLRRKFKRLEITISVDYNVITDKLVEIVIHSGKVMNISGAGLFIYSPDLFPVRTKVHLEISIPGEIAPLGMDGMVIWMADKSLQPHCYPGMGVKFIEVDSEKQKDILEFIDRNVTHRSGA